MNQEHSEFLNRFMEANRHKKVTLKQMRMALLEEFPNIRPLALSTIRLSLNHDLGLHYIKMKTRLIQSNTVALQQRRMEQAQIMEVLWENSLEIVFIDEFALNEGSFVPYSWAGKGEDNFVYTLSRAHSYSFIVASTLNKVILLRLLEKSCDQTAFSDFLSSVDRVLQHG